MQLRVVNTCFYVVMDRNISSIKEIKRQILTSATGMDHFQSCLVEVLGKLYYKRIHGEQLRDEMAKAFVEEEGHIANEAELTRFVQRVGEPQFDQSGLHWRVFLVKNYAEN